MLSEFGDEGFGKLGVLTRIGHKNFKPARLWQDDIFGGARVRAAPSRALPRDLLVRHLEHLRHPVQMTPTAIYSVGHGHAGSASGERSLPINQ